MTDHARIVYLISHGEWDDYTVRGICSSREAAIKLMEENPRIKGDYPWNEPEIFYLDQLATFT